MRVLHIAPCYEPAWEQGGVVTALSTLCRQLALDGADIRVFTTNLNPPNKLDVPTGVTQDVGGVKVTYFDAQLLAGLFFSGPLALACRSEISGFDLVHISSFWNFPAIPAVLSCIAAGVPYVISLHGSLIYYLQAPPSLTSPRWWRMFLWQRLFNDLSFKTAAAIHYTAKAEYDICHDRANGRPALIVPNALQLPEKRDMPRDTVRSRWGLPVDRPLVAYIGRLAERKAVDVLIRAVAVLRRRGVEVSLALAYPPTPMERDLRQLARDLQIDDLVCFLGFVSPTDRDQLLSATDVVSLVSRAGDNFGYTCVEAMAMGVPVVVSEDVGISEDIRESGAGLVASVIPESIADCLSRILKTPELHRQMGVAARAFVEGQYAAPVVSRQMLDAYGDIVRASRA